jgi:hypothetical protein
VPTPPITLDEAAKEFQIWRSKRQKKSEPTPEYLKNIVRQLLQHYTKYQIIKKLGIMPRIFNNLKHPLPQHKQPDITFIPFKIASPEFPEPQFNNATFTCEIIKADGNKLIVQTTNTTQIIEAFLCSNSARNR